MQTQKKIKKNKLETVHAGTTTPAKGRRGRYNQFYFQKRVYERGKNRVP